MIGGLFEAIAYCLNSDVMIGLLIGSVMVDGSEKIILLF